MEWNDSIIYLIYHVNANDEENERDIYEMKIIPERFRDPGQKSSWRGHRQLQVLKDRLNPRLNYLTSVRLLPIPASYKFHYETFKRINFSLNN